MSNPIKNRYDFVLIFDVKDGNPNGDPDAGNLPRLDAETGQGIVTDVCLKRKVRNYVQLTKGADDGYNIYVKEKAVLGRAHVEAFKELGIAIGQESRKAIPSDIADEFSDIDLCDGVTVEDQDDDEGQVLVIASDVDKKEIKSWLKESTLSKNAKKLIGDALKEAKPRKPTAEETAKGRNWMCEHYFDIRIFGAVMSLKSAPNCGQVRGPVQLTFGRSVDPIVVSEHSITRMAVATEREAEAQSGDNRTMGRKNTVPYGLYVAHGFVSPALANQTGFNEDDLALFWQALRDMFEYDRSAARGLMATQKLVIFQHASALGNAHASDLFNLVKLTRKDPAKPARDFSDYTVEIFKAPDGVVIL